MRSRSADSDGSGDGLVRGDILSNDSGTRSNSRSDGGVVATERSCGSNASHRGSGKGSNSQNHYN